VCWLAQHAQVVGEKRSGAKPSLGKNTKKLAPGEIIMFPNQQIHSPVGMFVPEVLV
jgi:hypothetical protein